MAITLDVAKKHLDAWLDAELQLTTHQSYSMGGHSITRANLAQIRQEIEYWQNLVTKLEISARRGRRNRVYSVVVHDT